MKKNEVTTAQSTEAAVVYNANEWGDVVVEAKDLILPKILLQQALSEAVKQRVARDGDYLNTLTGAVCSNEGGNVHILPFYCKQSYVIEKWNGKKFEFLKIAPNIPGEQKPFEETIGTERFKNSHVYEFFCLQESGGVPALISFKSTSHRAGKQLFNIMYEFMLDPKNSIRKTPADTWFILGSKAETNDMGTYNVMTVNVGRNSTKEEIDNCLKWMKTIKASDFKVADEKSPSTTTETRF
jgi:hypothetical protein